MPTINYGEKVEAVYIPNLEEYQKVKHNGLTFIGKAFTKFNKLEER